MTQIKICGITNLDDALCAARCGADAIGFIFYPKSPRYVAPQDARAIINEIPDAVAKVGVFVNSSISEVQRTIELCGLDLVQLHGDESLEYCLRFPRSCLIKGIAPRTEDDLQRVRSYAVRAILVDAYHPLRRGGTGKRSDWGLAIKVKETHPLILAGGLSMTNIQEAIEAVSPDAVDVSSGVERSPGRKDHEKVREVIALVHRIEGETTGVFRRPDN